MTTDGSGYTTGSLGSQVCYINDPRTVSESGGYLNLSVIQTPWTNCTGTPFYSFGSDVMGGMVYSQNKFSQQYGFFEVRAAMPPTAVPGLQETLWLFPQVENLYGAWPDSGEIDFGEFYSEYPNLDVPVVHYPGGASDPNATSDTCAISGQTTAGQFHTYAVLWTPTTLTAYYDGVACITDVYGPHVTYPDQAPEPFNQPFFLNLTAALGWGNGDQYQPGVTPMPSTMKVDWVRVWQYGW